MAPQRSLITAYENIQSLGRHSGNFPLGKNKTEEYLIRGILSIIMATFQSLTPSIEPLFSVLGRLEITIMSLVCKNFSRIIKTNYADKMIKKTEIIKDPAVSAGLFNYLSTLNCIHTSEDAILHFIRTNQFGAARCMIPHQKQDQLYIKAALFHSPDIFDYLIRIGHQYIEDPDDVRSIVDSNNYAAIDTLRRHRMPIISHIDHAIDSSNFHVLSYLQNGTYNYNVINRAIHKRNLSAYKFVHNMLPYIMNSHIRTVVINEDRPIFAFMFGKCSNHQKLSMINAAIIKDSAELIKSILPNITIQDSMYNFALRACAVKILQLFGYRKELFERIIDTEYAGILDIFPEIATRESLTYAVLNNYASVVEWMVNHNVKFTGTHNSIAIISGFDELCKHYRI